MAWHRSGAKLLSEPVKASLPTHICVTRLEWVYHFWLNSTPKTPGRSGCNFGSLVLKHISLTNTWIISCGIALKWRPQRWGPQLLIGLGNGLMHQATSHYPSQCFHRSMSPYGFIRLHWVKVNENIYWKYVHFFPAYHQIIQKETIRTMACINNYILIKNYGM